MFLAILTVLVPAANCPNSGFIRDVTKRMSDLGYCIEYLLILATFDTLRGYYGDTLPGIGKHGQSRYFYFLRWAKSWPETGSFRRHLRMPYMHALLSMETTSGFLCIFLFFCLIGGLNREEIVGCSMMLFAADLHAARMAATGYPSELASATFVMHALENSPSVAHPG